MTFRGEGAIPVSHSLLQRISLCRHRSLPFHTLFSSVQRLLLILRLLQCKPTRLSMVQSSPTHMRFLDPLHFPIFLHHFLVLDPFVSPRSWRWHVELLSNCCHHLPRHPIPLLAQDFPSASATTAHPAFWRRLLFPFCDFKFGSRLRGKPNFHPQFHHRSPCIAAGGLATHFFPTHRRHHVTLLPVAGLRLLCYVAALVVFYLPILLERWAFAPRIVQVFSFRLPPSKKASSSQSGSSFELSTECSFQKH